MRIASLYASLALAACAFPAFAQEPKVNCDNAEVQMELNYCAEKDYQAADKELNAAWKKARATAVDKDGGLEKGERGLEAALLKSQRAWIDYRDGTCEAETFLYRGGTIYSQILYDCLARITEARSQELQQIFEDAEE